MWLFYKHHNTTRYTYRLFGYKTVYLPLCKVADTPFRTQDNDVAAILIQNITLKIKRYKKSLYKLS